MVRYSSISVIIIISLIHSSVGLRLGSGLSSSEDELLRYYSRGKCEAMGYLPDFAEQGYEGDTHFEKLFKSPLNIDLIAAAHSSNETGFEQVTADWGCDYKPCYGTGATGTGCESIGFYGPGAKDPAGGGCPRGPVRVYEDLTCAIKLGLKSDPDAFAKFCDTSDENMGMFECLAFFANVITETGAFAETEERDPRPYCWDRSPGNPECCPASDHKGCLPDSDTELTSGQYPTPNDKWLGDSYVDGKCCSYHGRGFLQVSYEPNYKALSKALFDDEKILWHYPYKLDSDGVMGWSAALWFWFNEHPAQVGNEEGAAVDNVSPRSEIYSWQEGKGLPGTINVINGAECSGDMDSARALNRVSYFHAIAHRMNAKPPLASGEPEIDYYPLPGTEECENHLFCKKQFHNSASRCPAFNPHLDCTGLPYVVNASTPMGFWRHTIKLTAIDGETPICKLKAGSGPTPGVWKNPQEDFVPIDFWWEMLDVHRENVCDYVKMMYAPDPQNPMDLVEGESKYCSEVCWKDFSWSLEDRDQPCDEPQKPCKTLSEYMSHPLPRKNWESGDMGDYKGGAFIGRVGPGLVMAMNGQWGFPDKLDKLCFIFGATACHWNIGMGCYVQDKTDLHGCRVFPPNVPDWDVMESYRPDDDDTLVEEQERPEELLEALEYYDKSNCPEPTGRTVLEQLFPRGEIDMDFLFSVHYSQSDGFANARWDEDDPSVNENTILKGSKGPKYMWENMLCAFQLGVIDDPDIFQKDFGLRKTVKSAEDVPYPLSEEEKQFAMLEFIALGANMIKETGAMGQAEEQDPRCYCNNQGGAGNECCPNKWGNNPPCHTNTDSGNTIISPEEMAAGTTVFATCCSYHGRGFLQTSYERNYGDLGALMFETDKIDPNMGRQFLVNYPQTIDPFGITGWTGTFAFWLHAHPCQFCEGKNASTLDWNAKEFSPHIAMLNYDEPGQGLGLTFTIINGQECEASQTYETDLAMQGSGGRLSLFYNLAYRLQVKAPGESTILPLPGTKECDASPWCRGTFYETKEPTAAYREHSGGCWALTPQPEGSEFEVWPWCRAKPFIKGSTKYGAHLDTLSFSMKADAGCSQLHEFTCGAKTINKNNKPSMFEHEDLKRYTEPHVITTDYDDPKFQRLMGLTADDLCQYAVDTDLTNGYPVAGQDCIWWCLQPSGAASCSAMDMETCHLSGSGSNFVDCANKFFKSLTVAADCEIQVPDDISPDHPPPPPPPTTPLPPSVCELCTDCKSTSGYNDEACKACIGNENGHNTWPCNELDYCKCAGDVIPPPPPPNKCDKTCTKCIVKSGGSAADNIQCEKCANGENLNEWPCNGTPICKCAEGYGGAPDEKPTTSTKKPTSSTTKKSTTSSTKSSTKKSSTTTVVCDQCSECVSASGLAWETPSCEKCANGKSEVDWPCQTPGYCVCG